MASSGTAPRATVRTVTHGPSSGATSRSSGSEVSRVFKRHVDTLERQPVFLGQNANGAQASSLDVDGHRVADDIDNAGEAAVHAVIAEQMRVRLDTPQIVDQDRDKVVVAVPDEGAQSETSDAAKLLDGD
jgi:hypothetical protein